MGRCKVARRSETDVCVEAWASAPQRKRLHGSRQKRKSVDVAADVKDAVSDRTPSLARPAVGGVLPSVASVVMK